MTRHPYRVREIAAQAGLSESTVERVLNKRGNVRASTAREVHDAIADLDRQRQQLRLGGRTFMIDLVMHAPARFSDAVRAALEAELPHLRPANIRSRYHLRESAEPSDVVAHLHRILRRGTHGVVLKAPDVPDVADAVDALEARGIPVVTLVTDIPQSARRAYVGIDNRAAGQTAAYLIDRWLGDAAGSVLVTLSRTAFRGEEEREIGFRAAMRRMATSRRLVEITESDGLDATMRGLVRSALDRDPEICAVYSIGGGNKATVGAFDAVGRRCRVFVGHDLDDDNRALLRDGKISAALHHDLGHDVRRACQIILAAHHAVPSDAVAFGPSAIQVVTPHNIPPLPSAAAPERHRA